MVFKYLPLIVKNRAMILKTHLYMHKIAFEHSNSTSVNTCYGFEEKTCYDFKLAINTNSTAPIMYLFLPFKNAHDFLHSILNILTANTVWGTWGSEIDPFYIHKRDQFRFTIL